MRSPYIEHAASGLPNPTRLEGEVRFVQSQDQQVLPHVVGERGGSVVECRTPEREVGGSKPTAAVLCP